MLIYQRLHLQVPGFPAAGFPLHNVLHNVSPQEADWKTHHKWGCPGEFFGPEPLQGWYGSLTVHSTRPGKQSQKTDGKITILLKGKSTISTGPFEKCRFLYVYQRVLPHFWRLTQDTCQIRQPDDPGHSAAWRIPQRNAVVKHLPFVFLVYYQPDSLKSIISQIKIYIRICIYIYMYKWYNIYIYIIIYIIIYNIKYGSNPGPEVSYSEKDGSNPEKR